jgi:protein-tyrosine phosphatase
MTRWLALDGAVNVRDLGGLPLAGGGATRPDVLVRADNLQDLSGRDVDALEQRGIGLVVDLRTAVEVELEGPGPLVGRMEIRHRSLHPEIGRNTDAGVVPYRRGGGDPDEEPMVRAYIGYLHDRPDSILAALEDIAGSPAGTIVHCAAGKDRTGTVVALALSAAGVERDAIVADYAATGERLSPILRRLKSSSTYADDLDGLSDDVHMPRPEIMARVLALLDERHGGPDGWLRERGFDPAALAARLA